MFFGSDSSFFDPRLKPMGPALWSKRYNAPEIESRPTPAVAKVPAPDIPATPRIRGALRAPPKLTPPSLPSTKPTMPRYAGVRKQTHRRSRSPQHIHRSEMFYRDRQSEMDRYRQRIEDLREKEYQQQQAEYERIRSRVQRQREQKAYYERMRDRVFQQEEAQKRAETSSVFERIMLGEYKLKTVIPNLFANAPSAVSFTPVGGRDAPTDGGEESLGATIASEDADMVDSHDEKSGSTSVTEGNENIPRDMSKVKSFNPNDSGYWSLSSSTQSFTTPDDPRRMEETNSKNKATEFTSGVNTFPTDQQSQQDMQEQSGPTPVDKGKGKAVQFDSDDSEEEEWDGTIGGFKPDFDLSLGRWARTLKDGEVEAQETTASDDEVLDPAFQAALSNSIQDAQKTSNTVEQNANVEGNPAQDIDGALLAALGGDETTILPLVSSDNQDAPQTMETNIDLPMSATNTKANDNLPPVSNHPSLNTTVEDESDAESDSNSDADTIDIITERVAGTAQAPNAPPTRPCPHVNKPGGCPDEATGTCPFHHLNKNKLCHSVQTGTPCPFGDRCAYLHTKPPPNQDARLTDLKPVLDDVLKNPGGFRLCSYVNTKVGCFHGAEACKFNHTLEGVQCPDVDGNGSCLRGTKCPLLHDVEISHPKEKWQAQAPSAPTLAPAPTPQQPPRAVPPQSQIRQQFVQSQQLSPPTVTQKPPVKQEGVGAGSKRVRWEDTQEDYVSLTSLSPKRQRRGEPPTYRAPTVPGGMMTMHTQLNGGEQQQKQTLQTPTHALNTQQQQQQQQQPRAPLQSNPPTAPSQPRPGFGYSGNAAYTPNTAPPGTGLLNHIRQALRAKNGGGVQDAESRGDQQQQQAQTELRPGPPQPMAQAGAGFGYSQSLAPVPSITTTAAQGVDELNIRGAAATRTLTPTPPPPVAGLLGQMRQAMQAKREGQDVQPRHTNQQKRKFSSEDDTSAQSDATKNVDDDNNPFGPKRMKMTEAAAELVHGTGRGDTNTNNGNGNTCNGRARSRWRGRDRGQGRGRGRGRGRRN